MYRPASRMAVAASTMSGKLRGVGHVAATARRHVGNLMVLEHDRLYLKHVGAAHSARSPSQPNPGGCRSYSGLMPANLITLANFSVEPETSFPKAAGEPASTEPPSSAIRALIFGSARPTLISLLSLSMISAGVFLGAPTPCQPLAS